MHTSWATDQPKQQDEQWVITGNMTDDLGNSFRIVVTTSTAPPTNELDLEKFMQLQQTETHKRFDIVFDDIEGRAEANKEVAKPSYEIVLNNFLITVTPVHVAVAKPYSFKIFDKIGQTLAPMKTNYFYSVTSTKLYARCNATSGSFATAVNGEPGPAASVGAPAIIKRSNPTAVYWSVILTCTGYDNSCEFTMTGQGTLDIK